MEKEGPVSLTFSATPLSPKILSARPASRTGNPNGTGSIRMDGLDGWMSCKIKKLDNQYFLYNKR